jgi:hypothetical protein
MKVQPEKDSEMQHYMTPLAKKTNELLKEGFSEQFVFEEEGLRSSESGRIYGPQDIKILKHYRFEGNSDPADMSILYVIEANDGTKGTVVNMFGTYTDTKLGEFMNKVGEFSNQNNPD